MIIRNICFFNHFHNGDIFHSKEFVRDILNQTRLRGFYAHNCASNIILDVDVESVPMIPVDEKSFYGVMNDTYFINTWIGTRFDKDLEYSNECSLRFNYAMYKKIYEDTNKNLGTNLVLKSQIDYFPTIDFTKYRIESINDFIKSVENRKKILITNGLCNSGQCKDYEDIKPTVVKLIETFKDILFIVTSNMNYKADNLVYTDDITAPRLGCDLNEIGYISTFCDIIIGRNSGPYCFATNKQNILNSNKTFFAFGKADTDSFYHNIITPAKFIFHKFENKENLENHLITTIGELKND